jgi:hypothetical protein
MANGTPEPALCVNVYIMSIRPSSGLLGWALLVVAALATGVAATQPLMTWLMDRAAMKNGAWRTSATTGSADANLYERAAVAVAGLYALAKEETVYYTAFSDSAGALLDGRCDYVVQGRDLPARWWSLTMYGADHYLVPNAPRIYSRHASNLALDADGRYDVQVSAREQAHNWLPAPEHGAFSLTLRLYNPAPEVYESLATIELPAITKGTCR